MKTLRRLAFLALFAAAGTTAFGQERPANPPRPDATRPGDSRPSPTTTADKLADVMPVWFKEATIEGKGDTRTFLLPAMPHKTADGKDTMHWSVFVRLHERTDRPTVARIFFPCKAVPADAHPERLADLMNMNGVIADSPAYFIISGSGKDRMLTLVTEMPADGLDRDTLVAEIKGLFRAAERTMTDLWGGDLSKPPAKKEFAKEEKNPLAGHWNVHDSRYNAGSAPPAPFVAGLNYLYFAADGTVSAGRARGEGEGRQGDRFAEGHLHPQGGRTDPRLRRPQDGRDLHGQGERRQDDPHPEQGEHGRRHRRGAVPEQVVTPARHAAAPEEPPPGRSRFGRRNRPHFFARRITSITTSCCGSKAVGRSPPTVYAMRISSPSIS